MDPIQFALGYERFWDKKKTLKIQSFPFVFQLFTKSGGNIPNYRKYFQI